MVCATLIGVLDYAAGERITWPIIYLLPVMLAAWFGGKRAGLAVSLASAAIWLAANYRPGIYHYVFFTKVWDVVTVLIYFGVVTLLLAKLRRSLDNERLLSRTDHLTRALNRRAFYETAESEVLRMRRHGRPMTVAYIDVDDFKKVNDQHGHNAGDELLQTVVTTILHCIRRTDVVSRFGGDEFIILFPDTDQEAARLVIPKVRKHLLAAMDEKGWPVTFSIGVLTCDLPPSSLDEMVMRADNLMFAAKQEGKNFVSYGRCAS